jgi:hypothetical protein
LRKRLARRWAAKPLLGTKMMPKARLAREKKTKVKQQATLWSIFCQFFRCTPIDVIGVSTHMRPVMYGESEFSDDPMWTGTFCDKLRALLFHELWEDNLPALAIVLQFAAIVTTDDRREWPLVDATESKVIRRLEVQIRREGIKLAKDRRPMMELCDEVKKKRTLSFLQAL